MFFAYQFSEKCLSFKGTSQLLPTFPIKEMIIGYLIDRLLVFFQVCGLLIKNTSKRKDNLLLFKTYAHTVSHTDLISLAMVC